MSGDTYRAVTSKVTDNALELGFAELPIPTPRDEQVLIKVEAVPLNPSDIGFLVGPGDVATAQATPAGVRMALGEGGSAAYAARAGQAMQVGAEGAGLVVDAGAAAKRLVGKRVAVMGGRMLAQYRAIDASLVTELPDDVDFVEAAGLHGNPITVLGMFATMRREGHFGLVHTAAASNLGQMLVKACLADGVPLVNVVRRPEQVALLKGLGATHVVDSSQPDFIHALTAAIRETGATLAFDATGGGSLASDILGAMERGIVPGPNAVRTLYGYAIPKQVYVYGGLDRSPTVLNRNFGMSWGIGGWLAGFDRLGGPAESQAARERIVRELRTTFASHFGHEVSFAELMSPGALQAIAKMATGDKYVVRPQR